MIERRLLRLRESMDEKDIDAVVLFSDADLFYFSGVDVSGVLVVGRDGSEYLFVSPLYLQKAKEELKDKAKESRSLDDVVEFLKKEGVKRVGIDFIRTTHAQAKALESFEIADFTNETLRIRMIKEQDEINQIKRAAFAARNAFLKVYPTLRAGITEKEFADELTYQIRKAGAEKESFDTIVASGSNAAYPHHKPTDKRIEDGEFVVVDFGAVVNGYHSDTTYTFLIGDKKDDEKKKLFNAVFYAQLYATEMIAPGRTKASEVDARVRKELAKYGLDKYFIHSTGHGVGLDVHEFPFLNKGSDIILQPNMVFTIEPGIYIPGKLGIRLEHMVLVHEMDTEVIAFTPFMEIM